MTNGAGAKAAPAMTKTHGLHQRARASPLFAQSLAVISPTMTAVLIIPLAFASAGQGTWLAYAFGTVMLLFVVFCLNQFAKRSAFAGSMYAYTGRGLGPAAGCSRAGRSSGPTSSSPWRACAASPSSAASCSRRSATTASVHPIVFFAVSALACWFIAYKDIRVSSILTLVLEAAVGGLHHRPGLRHPVQARLHRRHRAAVAEGRDGPRHGPGRGGLHLLAGRLRERHHARGRGEEPAAERAPGCHRSLLITGAFMVFMAYVEVGGTRTTARRSRRRRRSTSGRAYGVSCFRIPVSSVPW